MKTHMNEEMKKKLQERIAKKREEERQNEIDRRLEEFMREYGLFYLSDELDTVVFYNKQTGAMLNPLHDMPARGEAYVEWLRSQNQMFADHHDRVAVSQFVQDWACLDKLSRVQFLAKNVDNFDGNHGLWLVALDDSECAILQKAEPVDVYNHLSGTDCIEGVRNLFDAKRDILQKHGVDVGEVYQHGSVPSPAPRLRAA
ncbi:hypothetical protein L3V16_22820 [Brucella ciceri]|uniref:hypothetical protein n=1 Tax=Brucella ciceri TaxID=391287 RepID=UPI000DE270DF|nr:MULTISPECIES: hypothetical protein [Brucella]MCH6206657.1 hypothetical protein [Brucella ciceri]